MLARTAPTKKKTRRPGCETKDEMVYFTFWPILSFSFFIAIDNIVGDGRNKEEDALSLAIVVCQMFVHMFAISCLIVSITESFIAYAYLENVLCTRSVYCEFNAFAAAIFLLVATLLNAIDSETTTRILCEVIPWVIVFSIFIYEMFRIVTQVFNESK